MQPPMKERKVENSMPRIEVQAENGVVSLFLDDPARSNLLSAALCRELVEAVGKANADPASRILVIRARGKAFCAGADLEDLKSASRGDTAAVHEVYQAFMAVADSPLPTVAVVQGAAVGAGMNLALACDMRVVSETASFDTRFLQIGLHPGGGHAWMLERAVGWQQAARLLLLGQIIHAEEAVATGLALKSVADADVETELAALFAKVARTPRELLLRTKQSMRLAATQDHRAAFEHETKEQMWSLQQPAFAELLAQLQSKLQRKLAQR
jgi:enoyl-CoA hydratase